MMTLKENVVPALIIIVAALVVAFASIPLQNTEWAEGIRTGFASDENAEGNSTEGGEVRESVDEGPSDVGVAIYFLPLIKVSLLMGIGAFFTWLITRIIRFGSRLVTGGNRIATK